MRLNYLSVYCLGIYDRKILFTAVNKLDTVPVVNIAIGTDYSHLSGNRNVIPQIKAAVQVDIKKPPNQPHAEYGNNGCRYDYSSPDDLHSYPLRRNYGQDKGSLYCIRLIFCPCASPLLQGYGGDRQGLPARSYSHRNGNTPCP